jgi:phage gpG-like protein
MRMKIEVTRTSETSVDNYFTRQYIPEDNSELYTRRRENLKSPERGLLGEISGSYGDDWDIASCNQSYINLPTFQTCLLP